MKTLLIILIFTAAVAAKSADPSDLDQKIISHTFNEEFDRALKLSQDQIKLNPDSPKYYYYYINTKLLEYYQKVSQLSPDRRDEGRKALNKELVDYCENVVDRFDDSRLDTENKFYYGATYGYLARVYGMDGSWWGAFKAGLKAKNLMEEIIKTDPQFYDAYLVLGMLNYYADRLSGIAGFAASILGFSGDREAGLNYLQIAYNKGKITFGQTSLTLIEVYANLEDNEYAAIAYYENFLKKFPRNKRITNAYVQELINIWDMGKAEELVNNDPQNLIDDYTKARLYDVKGNPDLAIQYSQKALQNENNLWRGAGNNARFMIAKNAWLAGNNSLLKKIEPELADRYKEAFDELKNSGNAGRWFYKFSGMVAANASAAEIEEAAKLKPAFNKSDGFDDQFNLLMGSFYFRKNLLDKAEMYFSKCLSAKNERDKYNALKFLVDIYLKQTVQKSKAEKLLDIIDDFDNTRLSFRAKDLEKKYNL